MLKQILFYANKNKMHKNRQILTQVQWERGSPEMTIGCRMNVTANNSGQSCNHRTAEFHNAKAAIVAI